MEGLGRKECYSSICIKGFGKIKGKGKMVRVSLDQAMKFQRGSRGIAILFL
jgi:hypothetical protein